MLNLFINLLHNNLKYLGLKCNNSCISIEIIQYLNVEKKIIHPLLNTDE